MITRRSYFGVDEHLAINEKAIVFQPGLLFRAVALHL